MSKKIKGVQTTTWPEAAPQDGEDHIVTAVCGNSHLHWSFHNGVDTELAPALFWRTPPLNASDFKGDADYAEVLSRHLPQFVHDFVFGDGGKPSTKVAKDLKKSTNRSDMSIYIVSTVEEQTNFMCQMWASIPSRIFLMKGDDFFTQEEGRYESMGIDRLAALRGAADIQGFPALVFDGGTAWTYTAADAKGHLLGGGIGPGVDLKFRSLTEYTDALPEITPKAVTERVDQAINEDKPLSTFALDTKEGMMVSVISEFALSTKKVIKKWIDLVGKGEEGGESDEMKPGANKENKKRMIFITGGDGDVLTHLLRTESKRIVDLDESNKSFFDENKCSVRHQKHLVHYGMSAALMKQINLRKENKTQKPMINSDAMSHLGKRVAKRFSQPDKEGDFIFRGSVVGFQKDTNKNGVDPKEYLIRYDDDDKEHVSLGKLLEMFELFEQVGEKGSIPKTPKPQKPKSSSPVKTEKPKSTPTPGKRGRPKGSTSTPKPPKADSATKKRKAVSSVTKPTKKKTVKASEKVPDDYLGTRVSKWFGRDLYFGTITSYDADEKLWRVVYDDDDEEEFEKEELLDACALYAKEKAKDPKPPKKVAKAEATKKQESEKVTPDASPQKKIESKPEPEKQPETAKEPEPQPVTEPEPEKQPEKTPMTEPQKQPEKETQKESETDKDKMDIEPSNGTIDPPKAEAQITSSDVIDK